MIKLLNFLYTYIALSTCLCFRMIPKLNFQSYGRTKSQLFSILFHFRTSSTPGGSVASSVSSTTSVPTTPIFALKRRGSVDSTVWSSKPPPNPPPMPPPAPPAPQSSQSHLPTINSEVLSVKTLANMFDFKVSPIPLRPCSARLEDNHIFQRMAKQLDNNTDNSGSTFVTNLSQSNPL